MGGDGFLDIFVFQLNFARILMLELLGENEIQADGRKRKNAFQYIQLDRLEITIGVLFFHLLLRP